MKDVWRIGRLMPPINPVRRRVWNGGIIGPSAALDRKMRRLCPSWAKDIKFHAQWLATQSGQSHGINRLVGFESERQRMRRAGFGSGTVTADFYRREHPAV